MARIEAIWKLKKNAVKNLMKKFDRDEDKIFEFYLKDIINDE